MTTQLPGITLRPVDTTDVDCLFRWENDPEAWRITLGDAPVSRQMLWEYASAYSADIYRDRQLRLIICSGATPVGTIDITDLDPRNSRAMAGIYIAPGFRRRGIARGALKAIIDYCTADLCLHQLSAIVAKDNAPSLALFASVGFKTAGCLRSWLRRGQHTYTDAVILQKML